MRTLGKWSAVAVAGALVLAGCKGKGNENVAADTASSMAPSAAATPAPAAAPESAGTAAAGAALTDPQITKIALTANSGDSARGKTAETKATNPEVKSFARMMVRDHTALNRQATALAKKLNVTPAESPADTDLQNKVQSMNTELQSKTGKDYDKTYIDQEVQIHQLVLDDLDKTLIPAAQNPELKKLLTTTRAGVEGHLKRAQAIQAKLK